MKNEILIEDEELILLMPKKGFCPGHIVIYPKEKKRRLEELPEHLIAKMMQVANKLSSILFDAFKCQGTNILIQNGEAAGQINDVVSINVIPRFENDNLKFEWTQNPAKPEELDAVIKKVSSNKQKEIENKVIEQKKEKSVNKKEEIIINEKQDYLIKSIQRLP